MKKKFIFIFLIGLLAFSCKKTTETDLLAQEDIAYFQNIFENGYVFYDELYKKKPFEFNSKKIFKDYKKCENRKSNNYENGINQNALLVPLWHFLADLEPEDGHLSIQTKERNWKITQKSIPYSSEFYFEKKEASFFLIKSPDSKLLGRLFAGNINDLKKTVVDKQEIYMYAPNFREYDKKQTELLLDGKKLKIPIKMIDYTFNDKCLINSEETDDSLYIKCNSFNIVKDSEDYQLFLSMLEKISDETASKKYIILDLRGNAGGNKYYLSEIVEAIYGFKKEENGRYKLLEFLYQTDYGTVELESEIVAKQIYYAAVNQNYPYEVIEYTRNVYENSKNKPKKLVKKTMAPILLPQWEGKKIDAKIIVLTDCFTASCAEYCISYLYMMDKNNVVLVGQNTSGTAAGNVVEYELPNSKLKVRFSSISYKDTLLFKRIPQWKGETYGFYPDYWHLQGDIADTLVFLTGDNKLKEIIK